MNKETIYKQISKFNKDILEKRETKTNRYYYVSDEDALDLAQFIDFLAHETDYDVKNYLMTSDTVIDLAFGSGNLTAHLLFESGVEFQNLYLNDKFNNDINVLLEEDLKDIYSDKKIEITDYDFFKADEFPSIKADLLIFNPTNGGQPTSKSYRYKKNGSIDDLTETLEHLIKDTTAVIFYGTQNEFKELFPTYNCVFDYWKSGKKGDKHLTFAYKAEEDINICYEKSGNSFIEIPNCTKGDDNGGADGDLGIMEGEIGNLLKELNAAHSDESAFSTPENKENSVQELSKPEKTPFILRGTSFGNLSFSYKNILLKGVPGTGKSRLINESFIKRQLGFPKKTHANILRINIHSASSNADLMQGIGIATKGGNIEYGEKQGLILHHLKAAIAKPYEPFVIVLEEIQENSLNELIGDLIYLIEDDKRVNIQEFIEGGPFSIDQEFASLDDFLDELTALDDGIHFVEIPYLVSNETIYRKLIIPNNLYFFCTSNYRDDKKIIEDNLLRRFELIEMYPKYTKDVIDNQEVALFLETLNKSIITHFNKSETHPDRFMIGHASWINVGNEDNADKEAAFCRAFLKAITEFKDIREIEFKYIEPILKDLKILPSFVSKPEEILRGSYKSIIETLQKRAYGDILND